jgi:CheY-like chemotaxis protein
MHVGAGLKPAPAKGGKTMREHINILIVDDDHVILKSVWKVLNPEGYDVEGVLSGKKAVQKIKQNNYRLVITDLMMPGIDGITLIKWIRQFRPDMGIVVITGNMLPEAIKEARELGILSHVMKPFNPEMLRDAANKAIEMTKGNDSEIEPEEYFQPAKLAELDRVINQYSKNSRHAIGVLLHAQEILGYLPPMIQKRIALGLNMYPSEVRRIVSFHSCFRTEPKGVHIPGYISGIEKAWNSVTWMTGNKALHAVDEFINWRQLES